MKLSSDDLVNILKNEMLDLKRQNREKFSRITRHIYIQYVILFFLSSGLLLMFLYSMQ